MWADDNRPPSKPAVKQPIAAPLDKETLVGSCTAVLSSSPSTDGMCLLRTLSYLNVSEKERLLPKHKEAGEGHVKARCDIMFSAQAVPQSLPKMLISNGKSMGSNQRNADQEWRVLRQAKLHQQVFILSMEGDKDARWLGREARWGAREKEENGKRRGFASYPSRFAGLPGKKGWSTSASVFE